MSRQLRDVAPMYDNLDVMTELNRARRLKSFLCKWVIPFEMGHRLPGDHLQIA